MSGSIHEETARFYNLGEKIIRADRKYSGSLGLPFYINTLGAPFVIRLQRKCYKHKTLTSYQTLWEG